MKLFLAAIASSCILSVPFSAIAQDCPPEETHIVKDNETLSFILIKSRLLPLYGREGYIDYISKINNLSNPNLIYPSSNLVLKSRCSAEVQSISDVKSAKKPVAPQLPKIEQQVSEPALVATPDSHASVINESAQLKYQFYAGIGAGASTLAFSQSDNTNLAVGSFSSTFNPVLHLTLGLDFAELWNVELNYSQLKSKVSPPSSLTVNSKDYILQNFAGVVRYTFLQAGSMRYRSRLGLESNQLPYLAAGTVTDVDVLTPTLSQIDFGFEGLLQSNEKLSWLFVGRVLPLLGSTVSPGNFTAKMGFPFALSARGIYQITENFRAFTEAEYRSQDIKYTYEKAANSSDGKLSISAAELRLQAEYLF